MSAEELRKAAEEARRLAMECLTGKAPRLVKYMLCDERGGRKRYCVMGLLGHRAINDVYMLHSLPRGADEAAEVAVSANNDADDADRHGAVVFPLLALADACDEAAASEPERT